MYVIVPGAVIWVVDGSLVSSTSGSGSGSGGQGTSTLANDTDDATARPMNVEALLLNAPHSPAAGVAENTRSTEAPPARSPMAHRAMESPGPSTHSAGSVQVSVGGS